MLPSPELPAERRSALMIATGRYVDEQLARLRAPAQDAAELAAVLGDPQIGGFEVTALTDRTVHEARVGVEDFLSGRSHDELLVVYLSCHGVRDARGRLFFAAADTRKTHLAATGIESGWLLERLDECRARRQVLILDCCFSGAFAAGAKGEADLDLQRHMAGQGRGRVVLTASRAGEYSFEGKAFRNGGTNGSVFTSGLVQGLRTGAADHDHDGHVSVEDAYDYAYNYVQAHAAAQTPQRWMYGAEGKIWLARNPTGRVVTPVPLPDDIKGGLDSRYPGLRTGAVNELAAWLTDPDPARVMAASVALREVAEHDIPDVARAAHAALARIPTTATVSATTEQSSLPPITTGDRLKLLTRLREMRFTKTASLLITATLFASTGIPAYNSTYSTTELPTLEAITTSPISAWIITGGILLTLVLIPVLHRIPWRGLYRLGYAIAATPFWVTVVRLGNLSNSGHRSEAYAQVAGYTVSPVHQLPGLWIFLIETALLFAYYMWRERTTHRTRH